MCMHVHGVYTLEAHPDREENGRATSMEEKLVQNCRQFIHVDVHSTAVVEKCGMVSDNTEVIDQVTIKCIFH